MHPGATTITGIKFYGQWKSGKRLHSLPRHKNPGLEIVLVSKGELRWEVEGREVTLGADTLFFTLPWQTHGGVEELQPSSEISYFCVALAQDYARPQSRFGFHPAFGFTPAEERIMSTALARSRTQALPAGEETAWLFSYFFKITQKPSPFQPSRAREIIKLLIFDLINRSVTESLSGKQMSEAERRVRRFVEILALHLEEHWTLASMSRAAQLSRTQFAQLLKKLTGDTPITYLNRLRVREAQKLMRESNKSITEIAHEVGFNSSQYFATIFKQFTGMAARSFRTIHPSKNGL